jgi:hypothetical protein
MRLSVTSHNNCTCTSYNKQNTFHGGALYLPGKHTCPIEKIQYIMPVAMRTVFFGELPLSGTIYFGNYMVKHNKIKLAHLLKSSKETAQRMST